MPRPLKLLIVEDFELDAELLLLELRRQGFAPEARRVQTREELEDALRHGDWELVVSDHNLPSFTSIDALAVVKRLAPDLPFIVVSGSIGEEYAVEAMRAGASDFVVKARLHRLAPAVERELREVAERREQRRVMTALAESEERLRQAQKLEAIGRLAGGIAHDFNNLLTAILGYADLAIDAVPAGDPLRADIEEIKLAGSKAVDLTRQLLAFSRRQVLHQHVLDLGEVIDDVTRLLRRVIGEDIRLETNHAEAQWPVKADRTQLEQIVMNLAVNARDAMRHGGLLRIETANVVVGPDPQLHQPTTPGEYVRLRVTDTGEGIPPEVMPRIFEPFFTTKESGRGTGLGLATVYGIVQQSGGFIFVTSEVHKGTSVLIYLPHTSDSDAEDVVPAPEQPVSGHETIMVVEDEGSVRDLSVRVLGQAGYRVLAAAGPLAAIAAVEQQPMSIDLLLTDVVMPDMDGPALAERFQLMRPSMRVLFMSGFTGESMTELERFGEDLVLAKPFTPATLLARVHAVLSREKRERMP